ncbi:MAG: hypothetical protein GXZ06_08625, partial [Tissierellia bacterium]|nr:hypothetical protein [Tissierellia bacterium]
NSLRLRTDEMEDAKIHCAREHFKKISNGNVKYKAVSSYEDLMEKVMGR